MTTTLLSKHLMVIYLSLQSVLVRMEIDLHLLPSTALFESGVQHVTQDTMVLTGTVHFVHRGHTPIKKV